MGFLVLSKVKLGSEGCCGFSQRVRGLWSELQGLTFQELTEGLGLKALRDEGSKA